MNNKQIGLVIAGCKGGYRLLCSNGVVDTQEEEISRTLSDVRSVIRINRTHLTLYALEFTSQYKVYSVYRSCNDNGSGAFVNIVVYVPHESRIDNIRELLDNMIDYYFKEYVNPLHGTYYPGTYDNIALFSDILRAAEIREETRHFTHRRSKQDDAPNFYVYNDVSEVDNLFASPYRKEFFDCQEVMFMPRPMYESGDESYTFNRSTNIITQLSEQEQMPVLCLNCPEVTKLLINGIERDKNRQYSVNLSTDRLSISVKYKYCSEVTVQGLVSDLLDKCELKLDENTKTISLGHIVREYQNYCVGFAVNGGSAPNGLLDIYSDKGRICAVSDSKVSLSGEWLEDEWTICVQPYLGSENNWVCVGKFKPLDFVNKELDIKLQELMFNVSVAGSVKGDIFVNVPGIKSPINVGRLKNNSRVTLYLPKDIDLKNTEFDPSSPEVEHKFDWERRVLLLNCKVLEYQLELPPQVKKMVLSWEFIINQSSKKKTSIWGGDIVKISPDEDISSGTLYINGRKFDFTIDEDKILPQLVYVDNPEEVSYKYTAVGSDGDRIVEESRRSDFFPDGTNRKIESFERDVNKETIDGFTIKLSRGRISANGAARTDSGKSEHPSIKVIFNGCEGLYYSTFVSRNRRACSQQPVSLNSDTDPITVYDKQNGGKRKCVVRYNGKYTEAEQKENIQNGFTINHVKNTCTVEYKKSNNNLRIILVAVLSLVLLCLAAFFVIRLIKAGNEPANKPVVMTIEVKLAEKPDLGEKITNVDILCVDNDIASVTGKDGEYLIEIYWSQKKKAYKSLSEIKLGLNSEAITDKLDDKIKDYLTNIDRNLVKSDNFTPCKEKMVVESPFQIAYKEACQKDSPQFSDWKTLLDKYCKDNEFARDILLQKAREVGGSKPDIQFLKQYLEVFQSYSELSAYKKVNEELNKKKESEEVAKLKSAANTYKNKLQGDDCNKVLVEEFTQWWTTNKPDTSKLGRDLYYWCSNAKEAYNAFFKAENQQGFSKIENNSRLRGCFSEKQQVVLYALSYNKYSYDDFDEYLNYDGKKGFKKLIEMNLKKTNIEVTYKDKK